MKNLTWQNPEQLFVAQELINKVKSKCCGIKDHTDLGTFQPLTLVKEIIWGIGLSGQSLIDFKRAKAENRKWYDYHEILDNSVVRINYLYVGNPQFNNRTKEETRNVADFIVKDFVEHYLGFIKK